MTRSRAGAGVRGQQDRLRDKSAWWHRAKVGVVVAILVGFSLTTTLRIQPVPKRRTVVTRAGSLETANDAIEAHQGGKLPTTTAEARINDLVLPLRFPLASLQAPQDVGKPGYDDSGVDRRGNACIMLVGDSLMRYMFYGLACNDNGTATTNDGRLQRCGGGRGERSAWKRLRKPWGTAVYIFARTFHTAVDVFEFGFAAMPQAVRSCISDSGGRPVILVGGSLWDIKIFSTTARDVYRYGRRIVDGIRRVLPAATIFFYPIHPVMPDRGTGYFRLQHFSAFNNMRHISNRVAVMCTAVAANVTAHNDTQTPSAFIFDPRPYVNGRDLDLAGIHYTGRSLSALAGAFLGAALDPERRSRLPLHNHADELGKNVLSSVESCSSYVAWVERIGVYPTFMFMHRFALPAYTCEALYYNIFFQFRFDNESIDTLTEVRRAVHTSPYVVTLGMLRSNYIRIPAWLSVFRSVSRMPSCAAHLAELMDERRLSRRDVVKYVRELKVDMKRTRKRRKRNDNNASLLGSEGSRRRRRRRVRKEMAAFEEIVSTNASHGGGNASVAPGEGGLQSVGPLRRH